MQSGPIVEIQLWSKPPKKKSQRLFREYQPEHWQFAEKMGRVLRSQGHAEVEVRECLAFIEDDEVDGCNNDYLE